uniref:Reverse transcriptase domain-containing protein n=1 Tax=Oryzias melastigma TaxID=30732 RepID=A0A3B3D471_ORYME
IKKLKRQCRAAERLWRKHKLEINYQLYQNQLKLYNRTVKQTRNSYFANIISENKNNPRVLFNTIESLINPDVNKNPIPASASLCEDFADHFRSKIDSVRSSVLNDQRTPFIEHDDLISPEEALDSFDLVEAATLGRVFSQVNPTTCFLDPIPTSLFKSFYGSFESEILNITNCSLQTGVFPTAFKSAVVKPLLKKTNLDPTVFNNYRPVSNLPFLSKILEKLVFIQLNEFLLNNNIFEINQSGFRVNHSTETALLKIVNDIRYALDSGQISVLILLDLSAAFDTVDHLILINRLRNIGLSGTVLEWFTSYLTERNFMVSMDTCFSGVHSIECGVPQGSILGPLLFNIYMLPLGNVIRRHNISFHSYADDTQLYISMSPDDTRPVEVLFNCILDVKLWMANNFLQLNQEKNEILVIGPEAKREKQFLKLQELSLSCSETVRNLGVIFDSELTFIPHIKQQVKTGFYHLRNLARVRPILSLANMEMLMHAFIMSRIDYCNALLAGLPKTKIRNLQLLQNSAARVLTRTRRRAHIAPILKSLHWLPISFRIDFKILLMVFKCLNGQAPSYLSDLL